MKKRIFAFDLGKTSIGYCVRENHDIKEANSFIIEKNHSDATSLRERRRIKKTLKAHKAREKYFKELWQDCGLELLPANDQKFTKEFSSAGDDNIYTSCLLRIALLQNRKLEHWQIYKALHNALQRRGYDSNLVWKASQTDDDKENQKLIEKYTQENNQELISRDEYKYPCYYDAVRLGLWDESQPETFKKQLPFNQSIKVRTTNYVAPRNLVEKELKQLWINAQKQIPALNKYSTEEFLYGEYEQAYGSYINPEFRQYMGTERDWQGVLGQKIPRINNRIIAKCKLLSKRNVCKADTIENAGLVILLKLKNLRITNTYGEKILLNTEQINQIYKNWLSKIEKRDGKLDTTLTKKEIETVIEQSISDKLEPMKANISGRSSFCRRACEIMKKVILSGELYPQNLDISEFVDPAGCKNGITEEEIKTMLSKIGDWNNLYIPDNRGENISNTELTRVKTDLIIGNITNPIVRNRLQIFRDLLLDLVNQYGKPDEVILEFVRDGADNSLFGQEKARAITNNIKNNEKHNQEIKTKLEEQNVYSPTNFEKYKLLEMQRSICVYSGKMIGISDLDKCEIDHIYPRTMGGNDALYNKVLCYREENQKKKGRTPYEWLASDEKEWAKYIFRLNELKSSLGKKKFELLTSPPETCAKLIESYNALAETSHIARVAQQLIALVFGWQLQAEGEKRHIFVNNGASTAAIRKRYRLNSLLGDDAKKNRENDKHHALDAICISYSRDFKYDKNSGKDIIEGFSRENVRNALENIMPYPYTNKKPLKENLRPQETIYGLRSYGEKNYITNRIDIEKIEQNAKKIENIIDKAIKEDLKSKLTLKMSSNEWTEMLKNYIHPTKKTRVKKVMIIVSEGKIEKDTNGRERIGEFCDFGTKGTKHQFKHSKGHKGQILYFDEKNKVKVMPVYSNISKEDVKNKLLQMGCTLYNKGQMFYSGCLVANKKPFEASVYYKIKDENGNEKAKPFKQTVESGIYKLRTIISSGAIKLENSCGLEILTNAGTFAASGFYKYER